MFIICTYRYKLLFTVLSPDGISTSLIVLTPFCLVQVLLDLGRYALRNSVNTFQITCFFSYKVNIKLTNVHATSFLIYNLKAMYVYAMVFHKLILI